MQNVFVEQPSWKSPVFWLNKYFRYLKRKFKNPQYFYMSANNMDTGWADTILAEMDKLPQDAMLRLVYILGTKKTGDSVSMIISLGLLSS